jgi:hypothetical protein
MSGEKDDITVSEQLRILFIINILSLILSTITTVIVSMKCRSKCPCCECGMRPSMSLPTPPAVVGPEYVVIHRNAVCAAAAPVPPQASSVINSSEGVEDRPLLNIKAPDV